MTASELSSAASVPGASYRIGEAAEMLRLKTPVLRFWEEEFPQLVPLRTEKGQRRYTEEHMALLRRIQTLLYAQGMTIPGARRILEHEEDSRHGLANLVPLTAAPASVAPRVLLQHCVEELEELKQLLQTPS